jgi:hypothetical protein
VASPVLEALANAKVREAEQRETVAANIVNARLQLPPRMASRDEFPVFESFCREKGLRSLPARPATVAFFALDSVALGLPRILAVVGAISAVHAGLADPTLSPVVSAALATISPITPPRHWAKEHKATFTQMPRSLQTYVAEHEQQQDKAFRTAVNKALAKLKLENSVGRTETVTALAQPAAVA